MPLRLPPLSSLRFFEAAARHQSFKLAAAELNVTPSAVSHGIVTIAVSCAPTLAARWLLPRLHAFRNRWPDINVTVDTSRRQVGFPTDGFDFAIRLTRQPATGTAWCRLFGERLVPVCSPACRDTLVDGQGNIDLRRATLIHVNSASEDWQAWLDGTGTDGIGTSGGLRFDTVQLAFDAAIMGMGVAMGRRPLVERDLASGALVEISPHVVATETAYWLVSAEGADHRADLSGFRQWLLEEAVAFEGSARAAVSEAANDSETEPAHHSVR